MAILLINGCSNNQDHVDIQLDLYSSYGTMTQQKKNAILSETQIAQQIINLQLLFLELQAHLNDVVFATPLSNE